MLFRGVCSSRLCAIYAHAPALPERVFLIFQLAEQISYFAEAAAE